MKPVTFSEANTDWQRPSGMTAAECGSLPAYRNASESISCWRASWRERLALLIHGRLWLRVHMGGAQPPVSLATESPFLPAAGA